MANPYENSSGADPFAEAPPAPLMYTIPNTTAVPIPTDRGKPSAAAEPPTTSSFTTTSATTPAATPGSNNLSIFSVDYYRQYFNITTRQVLNRMTNALFPVCPPDFLHDRHWHYTTDEMQESASEEEELVIAGVKLSRTPDLYGPFWICTTLWITIGVIGNVMSRIAYAREHGGQHSSKWIFDFTLIPAACATVYLYCFLFGTMVWGVMKWKFLPVSLIDLLCLYGYSMFVFELVALLCVVPSAVMQWIVVLLGGLWSAAYLIVNLWQMLKRHLTPEWFTGIVAGVAIGHILLTISFKLYFFHYKI